MVFLSTTILFGALYLLPEENDAQRKFDELNLKLETLTKDHAKAIDALKVQISGKDKKISDLTKKNSDLRKMLADASKVKTTTAPTQVSAKADDPNMSDEDKMREGIKSLMNNKAMKNWAKERAVGAVKRHHSRLFKKLNLDEDTEKKLMDLIAERNIINHGSRFQMMMEKDENKRAEGEADREQQLTDLDSQINGLLGNQYETYTDYREKQREYGQVDRLNRRMGQNSKMNDEQSEQLADVMHNTNQANPVDWQEMGQEGGAESLAKKVEANNEKVLEDSKAFLDESQLDALKKDQDRQLQMIKSGSRFFGGRGGRGGGR